MDATALFTNMKLNDVLKSLEDKTADSVLAIPIPIDCIVKQIRLCVENVYFELGDSLYLQSIGVAMGCPLLPGLAHHYVEFFRVSPLPPFLL